MRGEAEREVEEAKKADEEEARGRAVREFERVQAGLESKGGDGGREERRKTDDGGEGKEVKGLIMQGTKRKFDLDEAEVERISKEDVTNARKAIDDEKVRHLLPSTDTEHPQTKKNQAQKSSLPSFWTPSLTPTVDAETSLSTRKKPKDSPICPASSPDAPHVFSQRHLTALSFTEEADPSSPDEARRLCPVCRKALSNPSRPVAGKICGHVFCRQCIVRLAETAGKDGGVVACYVCDKSLEGKGEEKPKKRAKGEVPSGVVELTADGTGFSAAGGNKVEKVSTNFQC